MEIALAHECGLCMQCCKLPELRSLNKPINQWCSHCEVGVGCKIYNERPSECSSFNCLWIVSPKMSDNLRPDICGVMFEPHWAEGFLLAMIDPERPEALKEKYPSMMIQRLISDGYPVVAVCETKQYFFLPDGISQEEIRRRINLTKVG